jgi:hypothetical protein
VPGYDSPRRHRIRDRRGRGRRGPLSLPGPLNPHGTPPSPSRRERFDANVVQVVARLQAGWPDDLADVEFGVEDVPWVDDEWWSGNIPLATLALGTSRRPTRIVVYRLPIRARRSSERDESELVRVALVQRVAELLDRPVDEVDPGPLPGSYSSG